MSGEILIAFEELVADVTLDLSLAQVHLLLMLGQHMLPRETAVAEAAGVRLLVVRVVSFLAVEDWT